MWETVLAETPTTDMNKDWEMGVGKKRQRKDNCERECQRKT